MPGKPMGGRAWRQYRYNQKYEEREYNNNNKNYT
jgi:hypothetical protein